MEIIAYMKLVNALTYLMFTREEEIYEDSFREAVYMLTDIIDLFFLRHSSITTELIFFAYGQARGKYGTTACSQNI